MDKIKILVVDDESRMRKLVHDFLAREGYEVLDKRILVGDTDAGIKMKEKIADLKHLIAAYRSGEIAERDD